MAEQYDIVKSYELKRLDITQIRNGKNSVSLKSVFNELVLFHDIDELSNSGYISITEQGNLINDLPIVGWERIDIQFSIPDTGMPEYNRTFYVYSVDNVSETTDTKSYVIHFASLAALINVATRLEKKYSGTLETILAEICNINQFKYSGDGGTFGEGNSCLKLNSKISTLYEMSYVAPCWKPFQFMKYLTNMAVSSTSRYADCLLFEQTDGTLELTSYSKLSSNTAKEFSKRPYLPEMGPAPKSQKPHSILSYAFDTVFNSQTANLSGMMGITAKVLNFTSMTEHATPVYYSYVGQPGQTGGVSNGRYDFRGASTPSAIINDVTKPAKMQQGDNRTVIPSVNQTSYSTSDTRPPYKAIKQSQFSKIIVAPVGINYPRVGEAGQSIGQNPKVATAQGTEGLGIPCCINNRIASLLLEVAPCTDMKLGDIIRVNLSADGQAVGPVLPGMTQQRSNELLCGNWFVGKIKYVCTLLEVQVFLTVYSDGLGKIINEGALTGEGYYEFNVNTPDMPVFDNTGINGGGNTRTGGGFNGAAPGNAQNFDAAVAEALKDGHKLGESVAGFESGNRGSTAIGWDKTGGTSYGKYQLSSKNAKGGTGSLQEYVKYCENSSDPQLQEIAARLRASDPSGSFNTGSRQGSTPEVWKSIATDPTLGPALQASEYAFIKQSHYDAAYRGLSSSQQQQISSSPALQEALWSTSIQHGAGGAQKLFKRNENADVNTFINNLYEDRKTQFGSSTAQTQAAVANRFNQEKQLILAIQNKA